MPGQILAGRPSGIHHTGRARPGRAGHGYARARIIALGSAPEDMIAFTSLLAHPDRSPRERIDPVALALLPYSSGTTGLAKGVMLTRRACLANVVQMLTAAPAARTDRILEVAPFFDAVGLVVLAGRALFGGATLVTLPRFEVTGSWPRCRTTTASPRPSSSRRWCKRWPGTPAARHSTAPG